MTAAQTDGTERDASRVNGSGSVDYDAIVVGARCAGSPTAMLLAQRGYRVLLLDRDEFPSDCISTHFIHPRGVDRLEGCGHR